MGAHVSSLMGGYARRLDRSDWTADPRPMLRRNGMSGMKSANERKPSTDRRTTTYTAEERETLRRQESRPLPAPSPPAQGEDAA